MVVSDMDGCPFLNCPRVWWSEIPSYIWGSLVNIKAPTMLRRNGAQSILTNCYLLTSHFFPIHPQLTFLFSILSFSCHSSSNSLCLSKVTLEETLSAKVTGMNKGLGFRFGQTGIQPVWAGLCKTWLDWLSQLLPQCAGCGPHSI